jgi:cobalt-zinc-cadmium efflux system membrane fusion protein
LATAWRFKGIYSMHGEEFRASAASRAPGARAFASQPRFRLYAGAAAALILVAASAILYRATHRAASSAPAATPEAFIKEGDRIRVPEGSPLRRQLTVDAVAQKEIAHDLMIPAVVEADPARLMKVLPPLAGRVTELKIRLGERVERGQPLLVMDSPDLYTAYADYDRGKVLLDLAAKNQKRLHSLGVGGGVALKDIQQADADLITANAEFRRADARLRQVGVDPETSDKSRIIVVRAPISGSVLELSVAAGAYWNDTTASFLTIANLNQIFVTANLPEKDTTRVSEGQKIEVSLAAYPGETFEGAVSFVSDSLDTDTRRTKVRIAFDNPRMKLKPGMFGTVTFFSPKEPAPVVPTSALLLKDDTTQAWVEVEPWAFEARSVDLRFERDGQAVIRSGLRVGDRVIVKGGVLLDD